MDDDKIDAILKEISKTENYEPKYEEDFNTYEEFKGYRALIKMMIDENLISKPFSNSSVLVLTRIGTKIIKQGGWKKHLEIEDEKTNQIAEKETIDFKSKKWIYKTRLLPYVLSFAAILLSAITLVINYQRKNESEVLKKELEKIKTEIKAMKTKTVS